MSFINDEFMIGNKTGVRLYQQVAKIYRLSITTAIWKPKIFITTARLTA